MTSLGSNKNGKLLGDIAGTFGTKLALVPITMLGSIFLARGLQPEGKGVYTTVLTLVNFAILLGSPAIGKASIYFVGRFRSERESVQSTAFWLGVYNGLLLVGLLAVVAFVIVPQWFPDIPLSIVLIATPICLLSSLRSVWESFLRSEQQVKFVNIGMLASSGILSIMLAVLSVAGVLTAGTAIVVRVCAALIAVAVAAGFLRRRAFPTPQASFSWSMARRLLTYGLPFATLSIAQNLNYDLDILIIQPILGNAAVGQYSIAVSFSEMLWYLPMAVGFVLFPRVASLGQNDAAVETASLMRWTFVLTLCGALLVAIVAEPMVQLLYGASYLQAAEPLRILLIGAVTCSWYHVLSGYMSGQGRMKELVIAAFAGVLINVGLNVLLIPEWGIKGAAIASTVSYSATGGLALMYFMRETGSTLSSVTIPSRGEWTGQIHRLSKRCRDVRSFIS